MNDVLAMRNHIGATRICEPNDTFVLAHEHPGNDIYIDDDRGMILITKAVICYRWTCLIQWNREQDS